MLTSVCLAAIVISLMLYFIKSTKAKKNQLKKIPGPKGTFIFGNAFEFFKSSESLLYYFRHMANKYKDMYELNMINKQIILLYHPKDVEVLINSTHHNEKGFLYKFLRPWLHDGLLLSSGNKWHQRRKILTPAFHFKVLRYFNSILVEKSKNLVDSLRLELQRERTDINSFITDFTINSICETAMGAVLDNESSTISKCYKDAIHELGTHLLYRSQRVWLHSDPIFNLSSVGRAQKRTIDKINAFRKCVIKQRRQDGYYNDSFAEIMKESDDDIVMNDKRRLAMLDLLLKAEQQGIIDSEGINEEVDTFMFEGHDTTATALQFAFMLLANHPDDQDRIVEEYRNIIGPSNRSPTISDLSEMKYLEACIKETLRLYPPVHFIERRSDYPLKLRGIERPPPFSFTVLIFDLHRRSDQFIEPLEFRPGRFLKEPTWHPFSYLPFSAGPRNCIGQKFAMMEMKLAISAVLSEYSLLPVTKPEDLVFSADIILRTKDPIYVKFEKRS